MSGTPYEVVIERKQKYDTSRKQWVRDIIPTSTVKKAKRLGTASADKLFGSTYPGAGSVFNVTNLRIDSSPNLEFVVKARQGTLDVINGAYTGHGDLNSPLYSTAGSFQVRALGSVGLGTYFVSYSGVVI